ncbi:MAG: SurA N-terminal domain-containing protein, partial [Bacteroidaceae bacterium]|nr:SurA N-terminal domain-containing protein [Bacteroidaceae bacterium]
MAALQKVRNAGPLVVGALFLGLVGFIATDWTKVVEIFSMSDRTTVGSVNGKDIDLQEFNELVDEYTNVVKASNGLSNLTDEQMQSVRDQVWANYLETELVASEAEELGLQVTDRELQQIIIKGEH